MKGKTAEAFFYEGYNCAQAVALAFSEETGLERETLARLALPLGAGVGRLREICGAFTGAAVCMGLLFPSRSKDEVYALVQKLYGRFCRENGCGNCFGLLSAAGLTPERGGSSEARTEEFYARRPCPRLVASAAELLEELIREETGT